MVPGFFLFFAKKRSLGGEGWMVFGFCLFHRGLPFVLVCVFFFLVTFSFLFCCFYLIFVCGVAVLPLFSYSCGRCVARDPSFFNSPSFLSASLEICPAWRPRLFLTPVLSPVGVLW